ncbi:MAG: hypothetical protein GXY36_15715 [Chloroflexi bacterium]|nr:hypothetical protein [Chloroflexota bacterium]
MAKKKAQFYRKAMGQTGAGETIYVICRMDRGQCDFVYAEVAGDFPGTEPGIYDASDYQYLVGASVKSLEHMGFAPV